MTLESPILKINGKRHTMGRIKAGTFRQIVLLGEDWPNYPEEELIEDCRYIVRDAFGLSKKQADQIAMQDVMPIYRRIKALAENVFVERAAEVPNAQSPEEIILPGEN